MTNSECGQCITTNSCVEPLPQKEGFSIGNSRYLQCKNDIICEGKEVYMKDSEDQDEHVITKNINISPTSSCSYKISASKEFSKLKFVLSNSASMFEVYLEKEGEVNEYVGILQENLEVDMSEGDTYYILSLPTINSFTQLSIFAYKPKAKIWYNDDKTILMILLITSIVCCPCFTIASALGCSTQGGSGDSCCEDCLKDVDCCKDVECEKCLECCCEPCGWLDNLFCKAVPKCLEALCKCLGECCIKGCCRICIYCCCEGCKNSSLNTHQLSPILCKNTNFIAIVDPIDSPPQTPPSSNFQKAQKVAPKPRSARNKRHRKRIIELRKLSQASISKHGFDQ